MQKLLILFILIGTAAVAEAQEQIKLVPNFQIGPAACKGANLSVRHANDDAAMGGHNLTDYAFKNESAAPCTLKGYPRFELLTKPGGLMRRGRGVNTRKLIGDDEPQAPQLVTIDAGKEAIFRVYTNNGGAGRLGKPCPTSHAVRIVAPGTTRAFVLKDHLTTCVPVQVSAVRVMTNDD